MCQKVLNSTMRGSETIPDMKVAYLTDRVATKSFGYKCVYKVILVSMIYVKFFRVLLFL